MPPGRSRVRGRRRAASSSRRRGCSPCRYIYWRFRFLVAWPPSGDLCIHAKHLLSCANPNHISGPLGRRRDAGSEPSPTGRDGHCRPLRRRYGKNGGKAPAIDDRGKLAERIEVEFGPFRPAASRRAECLLVALPTSGDLFICAKDLFVGAKHGWLRHREPVFGDRAAARGLRRALARPSTNKGRSKSGSKSHRGRSAHRGPLGPRSHRTPAAGLK